jgi:alanine racemase
MPLRALARVNLAAIERNVARLRRELVNGALMCAVVKADGYGHGAVQAGRAALSGGASWLAVATAEEAADLRAGGIEAPVLVMGALSGKELPVAVESGADVVAWDEAFVAEAAAVARSTGRSVGVHVKLDTGMGRLGTRLLDDAVGVATAVIEATPPLRLAGAMTHFATADDDPEFLAFQLDGFAPFVDEIRLVEPKAIIHAANSAATLRERRSHFDMVRCGIAIYGCDPLHEDPALRELEPALELSTWVAAVKRAGPGESAGYGRRFIATQETWIGTLPIGYGDGIARAFTNNCDLLIEGGRFPLVGTVSMDNITVDLGATPTVGVGAPVMIIGASGDQRQTAEELARRIDTINYEVLCAISRRVPRHYHRDGASA